LEKALAYGRENKCRRFALCTFASNEQAVALYSRFGMSPQRTILMMKRPLFPGRQFADLDPEPVLRCKEICDEQDINRLNLLDKRARGIQRPEEHLFWLNNPHHMTLGFYAGSRLVGYALIGFARGLLGPIVVSQPKYLTQAVKLAVNLRRPDHQQGQLMFVQGEQTELLKELLAIGFKVDEVLLEMATERLGDPSRYLPGSLAYY
jgi:hypothetical protein